MATSAQARKMARDLDELRRYTSDDYLNRPEVQAALAAQGLDFGAPDVDTSADTSADTDNGAQTLDTAGGAAALAADDDLAALAAAQAELDDTHAARLAADKVRRNDPDSLRAQRQAAADTAQQIEGLAKREIQTRQEMIRARMSSLADRIGTFPTPGGIGFLLLVLALLLLVLVPTNGQPRLVWLFQVIMRQAHLMPETKIPEAGGHPPEPGTTPTDIPTLSAGGATGGGATHQNGTATLAGVTDLSVSGLGRYLHE